MKIRILPEAEHDLEIGADFYESQRERLGRYSNDCLLTDIDSLLLYAGIPSVNSVFFAAGPSGFRSPFTTKLRTK